MPTLSRRAAPHAPHASQWWEGRPSADAGPMPEVYRALAERRVAIDVAFLGVGGCAEPLGAPAALGAPGAARGSVRRGRAAEGEPAAWVCGRGRRAAERV